MKQFLLLSLLVAQTQCSFAMDREREADKGAAAADAADTAKHDPLLNQFHAQLNFLNLESFLELFGPEYQNVEAQLKQYDIDKTNFTELVAAFQRLVAVLRESISAQRRYDEQYDPENASINLPRYAPEGPQVYFEILRFCKRHNLPVAGVETLSAAAAKLP